MHALGQLRADRHPHHPSPVQHRWRHVRLARLIHTRRPLQGVPIERLAADIRPARGERTGSATEPAPGHANPACSRLAPRAISRFPDRAGAAPATLRRPARGSGTTTSARGSGVRAADPSRDNSSRDHRRRSADSSDWSTSRERDVRDRARSRCVQSNTAPSHLCALTITESALLDALPHPAALGQDHRRAGHRRIDVEPQTVRPRRRARSRAIGSSAVDVVVPVVATTAHG